MCELATKCARFGEKSESPICTVMQCADEQAAFCFYNTVLAPFHL